MSRIERSNKSAAYDNFTTPKKANFAKAQGRDEEGRAVNALSSGNVIDIPSPYSSSLSPMPETPVTPPGRKAILVVQTDASDPEKSSAVPSPVSYIPCEEEEEDMQAAAGGGHFKATPAGNRVVRRLDLGSAGQDEVSANSVAVDGEPLETPAPRRKEKILPLSEALKKPRDRYSFGKALTKRYERLELLASDIRKNNKYNYKNTSVKIFEIIKIIPSDGRKKISYKLEYTQEIKDILDSGVANTAVYKREFEKREKIISKYIEGARKDIKPNNIRVVGLASPTAKLKSGLDEAFQTAETEYFFYCTAGLVAGKEWCSVTKEGEEITWLRLQKEARVLIKQSIFNTGDGHDSALFSSKIETEGPKCKLEGKIKDNCADYHNNRHAVIKKSSTPLNALYRAYRFMKNALINRSTFAKGNVFENIAELQKTYNTRSTTAPGAPKISKGVFTVDGINLVDKGARLKQADDLVISLRRAIVDVLRAIKNERDDKREDTKSVISYGTNDTTNSVFSDEEFRDEEFRDVEARHCSKTDDDTHENKQAAENQNAPPKRSQDDADLNSNVKKKKK